MRYSYEKEIIEKILDKNCFVYLRNDSIDFESKSGEPWISSSCNYEVNIFRSKFSAERYNEREILYDGKTLLGEIVVDKKQDSDAVTILDFLYILYKNRNVTRVAYGPGPFNTVDVEDVFKYYNYEPPEFVPEEIRLAICDYELFNAPKRETLMYELKQYIEKSLNGFELLIPFYKKHSFVTSFRILSLCPYVEEDIQEKLEHENANKRYLNWCLSYLNHFKHLLEFVIFSYVLYKGQQLFILLDENEEPVVCEGAFKILFTAQENRKLLPVKDVDTLRHMMKEHGVNELIYTDLEHFSARIREDIINGVVPKTYFVLQGKLHPVQLKISEIDLPEEVKKKIEEEFRINREEDIHTPNPTDAYYYSREYGFTYEQYIKYVINEEPMNS